MSFLVPKTLVEVEVYYYDLGDGEFLFISEDGKEKSNGEWETAKAKFQRLNQKTYTQCMKNCINPSEVTESGVVFDTVLFRDNKFHFLLAELVDGDGEEVKLDRNFFENVSEELVIALVDAYDSKIANNRIQFLRKKGIIGSVEDSEEEKDSETVKEVQEEA